MTFTAYTPDAVYDDGGTLEREIGGDAVDLRVEKWRNPASLDEKLLAQVDGLLVWQMVTLDTPTLSKLRNCKIIVRCGAGYNNIDTVAAASMGIPVCNTPDYGTSEVADHALAMLLALEHGLIPFDHALRVDPIGNFDHRLFMEGRRLTGRVFGTVGLGPIGTAASLRAKAFGMRVVIYDPYLVRGQEIALGFDRVDTLDALLARSDVITLHTPLNKETANLISIESLAKMKPGVIILNTARGGLIDFDALYDAMRSGRVRAAGIDVFPVEPPAPLPRLLRAFADREKWLDGRLVFTPHSAWSSVESRRDARTKSMDTLMAFVIRGELRNCVNRVELVRQRPGRSV